MNKMTFKVLVVVIATITFGTVLGQSKDEMIAQAVLPLPEDLRAGAAVYHYNDAGQRIMLRGGSNHIECKPRDENGFTSCSGKNTAVSRDYRAKLAASGLEGEELQAAMRAAEEAGTIEPAPFGSLFYRLYEKDDRIQLLWAVMLPNATSEELGMSTESQRDNSLAGMGRPWMMREGTPSAHLMIPINGTDLSNAGGAPDRLDTKAITDRVAHAKLPLPEDLKDGASVITYNESGERQVLHEGSNMIECRARDESSGFTRCYHEDVGGEMDIRAKLTAEGKSNEEIGAAIDAARENGSVNTGVFGSIAYRLYENDDKLKLLWVLRLPNATSAGLGMPIGSQRDNALAGKGLPWMMREGTASAHLMIPINSTQVSNKAM